MAIRKNKKRFDPRYFMDEKMEEPLKENRYERQQPVVRKHEWDEEDERRQKEWEKKQKRIKDEKDAPRGSADINYSLEEGLENVTPENLAIVAQAAAIVAGNFAPAIILGALGMKLKDAVDFLWRESGKPGDPPNVDEDDLKESLGMTGAKISQMKAGAQPPGSYDEAASMLYELIGSKYVPEALMKVKQNASALGDVGKLEGIIGSEFATEEVENAIRILKVLGKHQSEWDV